jgi:hypothetical protein
MLHIPKIVFEAGVPEEFRPKPVVCGVANRFQKRAENRSGDGVVRRFPYIDVNNGF